MLHLPLLQYHIPSAIIAFFLIPAAIALVDFVEVIRRYFQRPKQKRLRAIEDFVILVPIFGDMSYFKNAEYLKRYHNKVIICTTTHETPEFYAELRAICKQYGFRSHRSNMTIRSRGAFVRNPWKIFHNILEDSMSPDEAEIHEGREALLIESSVRIKNAYCMFLDGDTVCTEDLRTVMGRFVGHNYDLASVRILPSGDSTIMERLQSIEYKLAMDARKSYPWLTSGACMIAKTAVLQQALCHHSHFFQGGDIEIGKLTRMLGYTVGHIDTEFLTDVPKTFQAWFKQRVAWSSGDFRHAIININSYSWRHPLFFLYFTVVVYGMMPVRLWLTFTQPLILPMVIVVYWMLLFALLPRHYRSKDLLMFPFYAMVQCLIIAPLGILYYFQTVYRHRNVGIIRLRADTSNRGWLRLHAQKE